MCHPDDVDDDLSLSPTAVVVEYPSRYRGVLNYCNFEEYSKYIFVVLDVPIGRITKHHEEVPSIVSRVISTLRNILLY